MAPKKKEEVKEKPILGRFKNNLKACSELATDPAAGHQAAGAGGGAACTCPRPANVSAE